MSIQTARVSSDTDDPNSITSRWGIVANEYSLNGSVSIDLQDLMVEITKNRAVVIEGEVNPLSVRIRERNAELEELGSVLSELTKFQTAFEKDDKGSTDTRDWISQKTGDKLKEMGFACVTYNVWKDVPDDRNERPDFYYVKNEGYSANKKTIEGMISKVKSTIDGLNNESQMDMSRLQQLVDQRDQSYSTATTLMTAISDTRANLVRNL